MLGCKLTILRGTEVSVGVIPERWIRILNADSLRRLAAVCVAGLLLALCFPPYYQWYLFPLPFVLLHVVMVSVTEPLEAARLGGAFAVVFYLLHTYWFASFHPLALPFMLLWLGLVYAVWTGLSVWAGWSIWSGTAGWILVQWFLGVGYFVFPWSRLATALAVAPSWIQPTRYLGELVWGGVLVLFAMTLAECLINRRRGWVMGILLIFISLAVAEGYARYHYQQVRRTGRRVIMVQPNIASGSSRSDPHNLLRRLKRMTRKQARPGDLIVWPETSVVREPLTIESGSLHWRTPRWRQFFEKLLKPSSSLFFGLQFVDPVPNRLPRLNGAALLNSRAEPVHFYTKRRVVPGGEHLPLMGQVEWIREFGRMVGTKGYRPGKKGGLIPLDAGGDRWKIGVQICFEIAFSQHVRDQVNRGADLLINISNDSWSKSTASHWQHFYRARIRAVETGRMVLRNGMTGVSAMIDPLGRTKDLLPPYTKGTAQGPLVQPLERPLFIRLGDWITAGFILLLIAGGAVHDR